MTRRKPFSRPFLALVLVHVLALPPPSRAWTAISPLVPASVPHRQAIRGAAAALLASDPVASLEEAGSPPRKQQYLMTDDGFGSHLTASLAAIAAVIAGCVYVQPLHNVSIKLYYALNDAMMRTTNRVVMWSLLGLLSSSCCAIQIVLNALSFGCAGFNTVLGPIRPTSVALTIALQISSWYLGYLQPHQWRPIAASTLLCAFLTFLPEMLAWRTASRPKMRMRLTEGDFDDLQLDKSVALNFRLGTMGCASCVSTVSGVFDSMKGVVSYNVSLEDGLAEVVLEDPNNEDNDSLWRGIAQKLEAAGFPAETVR